MTPINSLNPSISNVEDPLNSSAANSNNNNDASTSNSPAVYSNNNNVENTFNSTVVELNNNEATSSSHNKLAELVTNFFLPPEPYLLPKTKEELLAARKINLITLQSIIGYLRTTSHTEVNLNTDVNGIPLLTYLLEIAILTTKFSSLDPKNKLFEIFNSELSSLFQKKEFILTCNWNQPATMASSDYNIVLGSMPVHSIASGLLRGQQWSIDLFKNMFSLAELKIDWSASASTHPSALATIVVCTVISNNNKNYINSAAIPFLKEYFKNTPIDKINLNDDYKGIPLLNYFIDIVKLLSLNKEQQKPDPSQNIADELCDQIINTLNQEKIFRNCQWNHHDFHVGKTPLHSLADALPQKWASLLLAKLIETKVTLNWLTINVKGHTSKTNETPLWKLINIFYKQEFTPPLIPYSTDQMDYLGCYLPNLIKNISFEPSKKNCNTFASSADIWTAPVSVESKTHSIFSMISCLTTKGKFYPQLLLDLICNSCIPLSNFPLIAKNVKSGFINTLLESSDEFIQAIGFAFIILKPTIRQQGSLTGNLKVKKKIDPLIESIQLAANKINSFEWARSHEKVFFDNRLKTQMIVDGITDFFASLSYLKVLPESYLRMIVERAYLEGSFTRVVPKNWNTPEYLKIDDDLTSHSFKVAAITARNAYLNAQPSVNLVNDLKVFLTELHNDNNEDPARKKRKSHHPLIACSTSLLDLFYKILIELRDEKVLPPFLDFSHREAIRKIAESFPHLTKETKNDFKQAIISAVNIHGALMDLRNEGTLNILKLNDEIREIVKDEITNISLLHRKQELTTAIRSKTLMLSNSAQSLSANAPLDDNENNSYSANDLHNGGKPNP